MNYPATIALIVLSAFLGGYVCWVFRPCDCPEHTPIDRSAEIRDSLTSAELKTALIRIDELTAELDTARSQRPANEQRAQDGTDHLRALPDSASAAILDRVPRSDR